MIGVKMNRHTIRHAFNKTKSFVGRAYNQTKGMLSELDAGVRMAKDIYSIASGPMESMLGENFKKGNKYVMNAMKGYDDIRSKVMSSDENIKNHYNSIVGNLNKKQIDIGL